HAYHGPWHPAPQPPPSQMPALTGPPPEFVGHQQALKVKNDINLRKDTIRLVPDAADPDRRLVSFTFDAVTDGRSELAVSNAEIRARFVLPGLNCVATAYLLTCTSRVLFT
uniref:MGRN1/RNF157-like N-terminal domain-containing protein n=1 Tax=Aegilops tauschii subsp. strangulata TaxID=200361 RepID=A0A452Z1U2_AEGTS